MQAILRRSCATEVPVWNVLSRTYHAAGKCVCDLQVTLEKLQR